MDMIEPIDGYLKGHPVELWLTQTAYDDDFSFCVPLDEDPSDELEAACNEINIACQHERPSKRLKIARSMGFTTD